MGVARVNKEHDLGRKSRCGRFSRRGFEDSRDIIICVQRRSYLVSAQSIAEYKRKTNQYICNN